MFGKGFAFSREELIMVSDQASKSANREGLAVAGGYHNSVLQLAVSCGVPAALLFLIVYAAVSIAFVRAAKSRIKDPYTLALCAGILGTFAANSGQMFMNGGPYHMFITCVMLGAMRGILVGPAVGRRTEDEVLDNNAELE